MTALPVVLFLCAGLTEDIPAARSITSAAACTVYEVEIYAVSATCQACRRRLPLSPADFAPTPEEDFRGELARGGEEAVSAPLSR
jgi:hypothetical protein